MKPKPYPMRLDDGENAKENKKYQCSNDNSNENLPLPPSPLP